MVKQSISISQCYAEDVLKLKDFGLGNLFSNPIYGQA